MALELKGLRLPCSQPIKDPFRYDLNFWSLGRENVLGNVPEKIITPVSIRVCRSSNTLPLPSPVCEARLLASYRLRSRFGNGDGGPTTANPNSNVMRHVTERRSITGV